MSPHEASVIVILILCINFTLAKLKTSSIVTYEYKYHDACNSVFKFKNEIKMFKSNVLLTLFTPRAAECKVTPFNHEAATMNLGGELFKVRQLGNGKLLLSGKWIDEFDVIDLEDYCTCVSTVISNKRKDNSDLDRLLVSVVTYNDTFDVFDWYQETCMPCRYNDKGEKLPIEHQLGKEPTEQDPRWAHQHSGHSLDFVEDAFGVKNGYFYVFRYVNGTTALCILDSYLRSIPFKYKNQLEVF